MCCAALRCAACRESYAAFLSTLLCITLHALICTPLRFLVALRYVLRYVPRYALRYALRYATLRYTASRCVKRKAKRNAMQTQRTPPLVGPRTHTTSQHPLDIADSAHKRRIN